MVLWDRAQVCVGLREPLPWNQGPFFGCPCGTRAVTPLGRESQALEEKDLLRRLHGAGIDALGAQGQSTRLPTS